MLTLGSQASPRLSHLKVRNSNFVPREHLLQVGRGSHVMMVQSVGLDSGPDHPNSTNEDRDFGQSYEDVNPHGTSRPNPDPDKEARPEVATNASGSERPSARPRGFAAMDPDLRREIARRGGRAAHRAGTAHEFTAEEAREAGRKGSRATHAKRRATVEAQQLAASAEREAPPS